jgi:hypothetical protein
VAVAWLSDSLVYRVRARGDRIRVAIGDLLGKSKKISNFKAI